MTIARDVASTGGNDQILTRKPCIDKALQYFDVESVFQQTPVDMAKMSRCV